MGWFEAPQALIPDMIAHHARWRGARPALIESGRRLDWAGLERASAQVANGIAGLGLAPGDRVAVLMDNSLEMAVLLLGILRSGCAAVPLNVSITDAAVAAMIEDSSARAVFASGRHCHRIDTLKARSVRVRDAVCIGHDSESPWPHFNDWLSTQNTAPPRPVRAELECNIIYSSGTTGHPKGIVHTHGCRLNWARELAIALRYRSDCVTLCSLGLFSNISWVAVLCTVLVGGTTVVMPAFDARAAARLIETEGVTHGTFVPLQLAKILALPDLEGFRLDSLDTIMCCGSPLALELKREFPRRTGCNLIELYGLTEGLCTILAPEDFATKTTSVGKPFLGSELCILGEDDRELPPGATGEVVGIGGLLMDGYHERDDANSEATWTGPDGRRWLRTGDLGYLDQDRFLYIVDRKKDMILSGGQNIYPADIEQVMREHADIEEVAVVAAVSRKWGETPVAIVVLKPGKIMDKDQLIAWTNERVGKQQRIADVIWRTGLPRNANGKILKRELRAELAGTSY